MRLCFGVFILPFVLLAPKANASEQQYVSAPELVVYSQPSSKTSVVAHLPINTRVRVNSENKSGAYIEIEFFHGTKGFANASHLGKRPLELKTALAKARKKGSLIWAQRAAAISPGDLRATNLLAKAHQRQNNASALKALSRQKRVHKMVAPLVYQEGSYYFVLDDIPKESVGKIAPELWSKTLKRKSLEYKVLTRQGSMTSASVASIDVVDFACRDERRYKVTMGFDKGSSEEAALVFLRDAAKSKAYALKNDESESAFASAKAALVKSPYFANDKRLDELGYLNLIKSPEGLLGEFVYTDTRDPVMFRKVHRLKQVNQKWTVEAAAILPGALRQTLMVDVDDDGHFETLETGLCTSQLRDHEGHIIARTKGCCGC